jgi:hypothetical protein
MMCLLEMPNRDSRGVIGMSPGMQEPTGARRENVPDDAEKKRACGRVTTQKKFRKILPQLVGYSRRM